MEALLSAAVASLAGAVVALFSWFKTNHEKTQTRLDDCENDREKLWEKITELRGVTCTDATCKDRVTLTVTEGKRYMKPPRPVDPGVETA
jgi:hypothetical protein